jgi:hypothetical protein
MRIRRTRIFMNWLMNNKKVSTVHLRGGPGEKVANCRVEFATMEAARCYLEENGEP